MMFSQQAQLIFFFFFFLSFIIVIMIIVQWVCAGCKIVSFFYVLWNLEWGFEVYNTKCSEMVDIM